jgi:hypothetical protein
MFKGVNWLAVVAGGIFNWLFGGLYFDYLMAWWFRRIIPNPGAILDFTNPATLIGLALSLCVATGLATVMARAGTRTIAGAMAIAVLVCFCFDSTVYLAYISAGEKPQLQLFIAVYDQVSYVLTAVVIRLLTRGRPRS